MTDVIKSDIEKIERALNIRVEDVEIEVALNAAFPQTIGTLFPDEQIADLSDCYHLVENFNPDVLTFATALNLCYQRQLFQLSNQCQSIDPANQSHQTEILPVQFFELHTDSIASHLSGNQSSIQNLRRMMQREEKARLTSNETIEKLIESVARNLRENREHQLNRRMEILQTSTRDISAINCELEVIRQMLADLRVLSNRQVIEQEHENNALDWTNISEILMNNQYSEKCCRHAWQQLCLPMVQNSHKWSLEEDQLLISLVQIHGAHANQWQFIALNFSHRSSYMCAARYMFLENTRLDKIKFSHVQLNELKQVVEDSRHENYVPLNKIAYKLGCSLVTVRREWRQIDPSVRRGQWQVDEDESLLRSVLKQSNRQSINWNLVTCDVSGRSQTKCYHRYVHLTRKSIRTEFEPEEDRLLIEQHQLQNARWSRIQTFFPERSCYTLQNRWRKLMQYRQINDLFHSQPCSVQLFILQQFPLKTPVITSGNHPHDLPNFQLTHDQLQCLISNSLFIQFCHEVDLNQIIIHHIGIRQFLNQLRTCDDTEQIKRTCFSSKKTRRKSQKGQV